MKLLDRSLLREMVVPYLIGQAAIVLMLIGTVLYNNASVLLLYQVPMRYVVRMVLYFIPFLLHMTMPVAMAVGASLAVSRLGRDSEITILRASGASLVRIFRPIFILGLIVSVADFYFGEYVVPASVQRFDAVLAEIPNNIPRLAPLSGQWIVSSDQSYALFVKTIIPLHQNIELHGVEIVSSPKAIYSGESAPVHIFAANGRYENGRWILDHPSIFTYSLNGKKVSLASPETFELYVPVDPQAFQSGFLLQLPMWSLARTATRTFSEMGADLKREKQQGITDIPTILDYHFKLSIPFSCLVMALCCPPLALRFARGGGFMGTLLSICLVFVYWNTMLLTRILGSPGPENSAPLLAPQIAAWSQNVIFIVLGLIVLRKSE